MSDMGILTEIIGGLTHLAVVLIDMAIALHMVHLLVHRLSWSFLEPFARVGRPLTDHTVKNLRQPLERLLSRSLSRQALVAVGMLLMLAARVALVTLFNALFVG